MTKEKILVVDDEQLIRWSLSKSLEKEGYSVITVDSAEKALKIFSEKTIHLILLDNNLPGINGVEMLERVREIDADV
ncbi:MAG: response regulator, partial [Candidatus Cloacimonadota bacterium]